jgi:hypothetical protein
MDVYPTDLPASSGHATDQVARVKVSRARAMLTFFRAKTLTAPNPAWQSGFSVPVDVLERIPSQASPRFWG